MDSRRREALAVLASAGVLGALAAAGLVTPFEARAAEASRSPFESKTVAEALKTLGAGQPEDGHEIALTVPDIAENGAVVPVSATSSIPETESLSILVAKNPYPLAAIFSFPRGTQPFVSARVKMAETSTVMVLVKAQGKFYATGKDVKVTLGGCGG